MHEQFSNLIAAVPQSAIKQVATGVIGTPTLSSDVRSVSVLTDSHAARETIAVLKITGTALVASAETRSWSTVAKLVDLSQEPDGWTRWTRPEIEEVVYRERYFSEDLARFRPATCYLVSELADGVKIFWLEDLTDIRHQPFSVSELGQMASHLGEWSGTHLSPPPLKFDLPIDIFATRGNLPASVKAYELSKTLEPDAFRPYYRDVPVEVLHELRSLLREQNERAKGHPHGLAFGDCQVGNLFLGDGETVAVDWTSLASDPVGADGGAMIGSAFTWGPGVAEIAENERYLFSEYMTGLKAGGWRGNEGDLRRGYFCQFGHYLLTGIALMPVLVDRNVWPRADLEKRFGVAWQDLADLVAPITALLPSYVAELRALAE
jgi:hypothetical protein